MQGDKLSHDQRPPLASFVCLFLCFYLMCFRGGFRFATDWPSSFRFARVFNEFMEIEMKF